MTIYIHGYLCARYQWPGAWNPWPLLLCPAQHCVWAEGHADALADARLPRIAPRLAAEFEPARSAA